MGGRLFVICILLFNAKCETKRQRDLLLSCLFTLVANGLGRLMEVAKTKGLFNGFVIKKEKVEVSHL